MLPRPAVAAAVALATLASPALASQEAPPALGVELGLWTLLPFGALLFAIAVLPLAARHWWESNRNKALLAVALSAPIAVYLIAAFGASGLDELGHKAREYAGFMLLLGSLYVISGGVHVRGSLSGTPLVNTGILALGAVLASLIGTTGASVLLIRPLLRANASRERKVHIVLFFIFVVSNCGGLLTPLGDPPLLLGYLRGVPFEWSLQLWPQWLLVNGVLVAVFNAWDQYVLDEEELRRPGSQLEELQRHEPLRIDGVSNFAFLLGVVAVVYFAGSQNWPLGVSEGALIALSAAAWLSTRPVNRERNKFTWGPIVEVAVLFAGIFVTMTPALLILNAWGLGQREVLGHSFAMREPWQFFWSTGVLSSFLDNAPTYLTFASTACGLEGVPLRGAYLGNLIEQSATGAGPRLLAAISCGAVFMGANTYIGNGPNFMVKAIAEESGVAMPSFFAYMTYSCSVLLPLFVAVSLIFFR